MRATRILPALAGLALVAVPALPLASQVIAITGGTVYPVSGPRIENGTVVITNGVITAVGANVAVPAGAQRIDATGKWVTPGFVAANTQLGVVEVGAVGETRDASARGKDNVAAAFRVWDGLNATSTLFAPARQDGGVTTVGVWPRGNLIAGQAAVLDLRSEDGADLVRRAPALMVAQLGSPGSASASSRGEELAKLRAVLADARLYRTARVRIDAGQSRTLAASVADLQALQPVLAGTLPLAIAANRSGDILNAIALGREFGLRIVIAGGAEAWRVAPQLAAARVPVLAGAMSNIPESFATLGTAQENLGLLRKAGVTVAIVGNGPGDEDAYNVRNLRYEAGNAVAYGMSWDDALRAVTLAPAEILGVGDKVGTLQPGKDANVVVWSGDPFEYASRPEQVFVRGRVSTARTRQQLLTERYLRPSR
jgi:imidazolonepropionase-like amidohydrolase